MQTITIDLNKSPEIKEAAVDLQPGDRVMFPGTVKSKDDQTLVVTVDEMEIPEEEEETEEEATGEAESEAPVGGNEGNAGAPEY